MPYRLLVSPRGGECFHPSNGRHIRPRRQTNNMTYCITVNKRTKQSFDFSINRIFTKLFRTGSVALVEDCQRFLHFLHYQVDVKTVKFLQKYKALENRICSLFGQEADRQLRNLCTAHNLPSGSSASKILKQIRSKFFKLYNNV